MASSVGLNQARLGSTTRAIADAVAEASAIRRAHEAVLSYVAASQLARPPWSEISLV